jgi:hypothetical protein
MDGAKREDLLRGQAGRIAAEHDEVGQLSRLQRTDKVLDVPRVRAAQAVGVDGLLGRERFLRRPLVPRDGRMQAREGIELLNRTIAAECYGHP